MSHLALLLTGCVHPAAPVAQADPLERLTHTIAAIRRWDNEPSIGSITITDAAGFVPPATWRDELRESAGIHKPVEWLVWDLTAQARAFGKGRSEHNMFGLALDASPLIGDRFVKCTARTAVANWATILPRVSDGDFVMSPWRHGRNYAGTRLWYSTRDFWRNNLAHVGHRIHDFTWPRSIIETVYAGIPATPFSAEPHFIGHSGTCGALLDAAFPGNLLADARAIAAAWLGHRGPSAPAPLLRRAPVAATTQPALPLITILTRHRPERAAALARLCASLEKLGRYDHVILRDLEPRPDIARANALLADHRDPIRGDYVWVIDDDDVLVAEDAAAQIASAATTKPDLVVVGQLHGEFVYPHGDKACSSCLIVRRDLWGRHRAAWRGGRHGDSRFFRALLTSDPTVARVDRVLVTGPANHFSQPSTPEAPPR